MQTILTSVFQIKSNAKHTIYLTIYETSGVLNLNGKTRGCKQLILSQQAGKAIWNYWPDRIGNLVNAKFGKDAVALVSKWI